MYRCPKCHCELPANARFCNTCGFIQTRTIAASSDQAQQEISSASYNPVQLPTDAPSSLPPQTPMRIVQPTAKRTLAARSHPPITNAHEPMHPLQSLQPPESPASLQEKVPVQPSLRVPGMFGLSLPSMPRASVKEQLSPLAGEPLPTTLSISETPQQPQFSEVSAVLIPATDPSEGHSPVHVTPPAPAEPLQWDTGMSSSESDDFLSPGAGSIAATSKAAEHWRNSWRNRQLAEASPAMGVSRGQALVSEPLIAMQPTLLQTQATLLPANENKQPPQAMDFGFWVTMIMMLLLLGGLGAYIVSTYLPGLK